METRIYKTKVPGDVKDFVLGRISAAQEIICKNHPKRSGTYAYYTIVEVDDKGVDIRNCSTTFTVETDQKRYDEFSLLVADWYPEIDFEFDITGPKN